jgi:hypothetical protein
VDVVITDAAIPDVMRRAIKQSGAKLVIATGCVER